MKTAIETANKTARCSHPKVKKFGKYGRLKIQRYRCLDCGATISDPKPQSPLGKMRIDLKNAVKAIQCLIEGCSIRSTERLTGLNRNTIMSLLVLAGERCVALMEDKMRNLKFKHVQCDELWTFVFKKQKRVRKDDPKEFGDAWLFIAIDDETKLIPCYVVGKRDRDTTTRFLKALKATASDDRFQLTTDGFHFYERGVENVFAGQTDFAQLIKLYGDHGQHDTEARYSPGRILEVISKIRDGRPDPDHICTSHIERQNLTVRMQMRRLTRLTNAFSRKGLNLKAAAALHFAYYNFCRVHKTLRVTPAMEHNITDHIWTIAELLESK